MGSTWERDALVGCVGGDAVGFNPGVITKYSMDECIMNNGILEH